MLNPKLLLLVLFLPLAGWTQVWTGISTNWDDDFSEWTIHTNQDGLSGWLKMRWISPPDPTNWDFEIEDVRVSIRFQSRNQLPEWEFRSDGHLVRSRQLWAGDPTEWVVTDDRKRIILQAVPGEQLCSWKIRDGSSDTFAVYTVWDNDPRDWVIHDRLQADWTPIWKMALLFTAISQHIH